MSNDRETKAKLNIYISLLGQAITLVCGLIVPRLLLRRFGSEAYGATASITQFLSYITLFEGGVGGVARAALYKPLANNDKTTISKVIYEIQDFFRILGIVFFVYVVILACSFYSIAGIECLDWISTCLLVVIISISTITQYFIGISYSVLIQADQKSYITQLIFSSATILNTLFIVILIKFGFGLILVKFVSSIVLAARPILTWLYVKRNYDLPKTMRSEKKYLTQKWTGLGQHLAYFVHNNTDIVVLTIIDNLKSVAIYSVYNMVISNLQNLVSAFSTGMEAFFGDMIAKKEWKLFNDKFCIYESIISIISCVTFGITMFLIIPFVIIYTKDVNDANYIQPFFAVILSSATVLYCWMMPYNKTVLAAGHFKQTKWGPYGEAIANIIISVILVKKLGLIGVAIGTFVATLYCFLFYAIYISRHLCKRPIRLLVRRLFVNVVCIIIIIVPGFLLISNTDIHNWWEWIICGAFAAIYAIIITLILNLVTYKESTVKAINMLLKK